MKIENHFETYIADIEAYLKSLTDEKEDCYIPEYLRKEIAVYCVSRMTPIISDMIYERDREWSKSMRKTRRDIPTDEQQIALLKAENDELKFQKSKQEAISQIFFPEKTETFFDDMGELEKAERCQSDGMEPEPDDRPACCKDHGVYGATCDTCEYGEGEPEEPKPEKKVVLNILHEFFPRRRLTGAKDLQSDLIGRDILASLKPGVNQTIVETDHVKIVMVNKTDLEYVSMGELYDEAFWDSFQPASRDYLKDRDKKRFNGTLFEYILKQEGR